MVDKHDGGECQESAIKAIELHEQNNKHQSQRSQHGAAQKGVSCGSGFLIGTAQAHIHAAAAILGYPIHCKKSFSKSVARYSSRFPD